MLTLANVSDILILLPLAVGIVLVILGSRLQRGVALGVASITTILMIVAAVILAGNAVTITPQLQTFLSFGNSTIQLRIDGFSALLSIVFSAIVTPVLIWMTTPRTSDSLSSAIYAKHSMGFSLIAIAFTLAAILVDNYFLIALCWALVIVIGWVMSRADHFSLPTSPAIWGDLAIPILGPLLFALAMQLPYQIAHTQSLLNLTGQGTTAKPLFTFASGLLVIVILGFAAGQYPFIAWTRNLIRGGTSESTAALLLLNTPIAMMLLARFSTIAGLTWPQLTISSLSLTLNIVIMFMGILTVLVSGLLLLFERDALSFAGFMASLTTGWFFVAIGLGTDHALLGSIFIILAYLGSISFFLATLSSLEWAGFDQDIRHMAGLAREHPFHAVTLAFSMLTIVGTPFLLGFAGMSLINSLLILSGGLAALGGAIMWIGNGFALFGIVQVIAMSWRQRPTASAQYITQRDDAGLILAAAILIVLGIAPELLLFSVNNVPGIAQIAAGSLLTTGTDISSITVTALGFSSGANQYLPGLLWLLFIVVAGILALSAGTFSPAPEPSSVFTGGSAWQPETDDAPSLLTQLAVLAHSPVMLPGPAAWRYDDSEEIQTEESADTEDAPSQEPAAPFDAVASEESAVPEIVQAGDIQEIATVEEQEPDSAVDDATHQPAAEETEQVKQVQKSAPKAATQYSQHIPVKHYPQSTHKGKKGGSKRHG